MSPKKGHFLFSRGSGRGQKSQHPFGPRHWSWEDGGCGCWPEGKAAGRSYPFKTLGMSLARPVLEYHRPFRSLLSGWIGIRLLYRTGWKKNGLSGFRNGSYAIFD